MERIFEWLDRFLEDGSPPTNSTLHAIVQLPGLLNVQLHPHKMSCEWKPAHESDEWLTLPVVICAGLANSQSSAIVDVTRTWFKADVATTRVLVEDLTSMRLQSSMPGAKLGHSCLWSWCEASRISRIFYDSAPEYNVVEVEVHQGVIRGSFDGLVGIVTYMFGFGIKQAVVGPYLGAQGASLEAQAEGAVGAAQTKLEIKISLTPSAAAEPGLDFELTFNSAVQSFFAGRAVVAGLVSSSGLACAYVLHTITTQIRASLPTWAPSVVGIVGGCLAAGLLCWVAKSATGLVSTFRLKLETLELCGLKLTWNSLTKVIDVITAPDSSAALNMGEINCELQSGCRSDVKNACHAALMSPKPEDPEELQKKIRFTHAYLQALAVPKVLVKFWCALGLDYISWFQLDAIDSSRPPALQLQLSDFGLQTTGEALPISTSCVAVLLPHKWTILKQICRMRVVRFVLSLLAACLLCFVIELFGAAPSRERFKMDKYSHVAERELLEAEDAAMVLQQMGTLGDAQKIKQARAELEGRARAAVLATWNHVKSKPRDL